MTQPDSTTPGGIALTNRISCKTVTFAHPFQLPGISGQQRAGSYEVETEEEPIAEVSYPAWRRLSTIMRIQSQDRGLSVEMIPVDPLWLAQALDDDQVRVAQSRDSTAVGLPEPSQT